MTTHSKLVCGFGLIVFLAFMILSHDSPVVYPLYVRVILATFFSFFLSGIAWLVSKGLGDTD